MLVFPSSILKINLNVNEILILQFLIFQFFNSINFFLIKHFFYFLINVIKL